MSNRRLVKSIIRSNRGFSVGLLIMFTIMIVMVFFSLIFSSSLISSLNDFTHDYHLADAWITTSDIDCPVEKLEDIDKVSHVDASFVADADIRFRDNDVCSTRIFSVLKDGRQKFYSFDGYDNQDFDTIGLSQRFASIHDISVGDNISIDAPDGWVNLEVGSIVSTPECMVCARDELSRSDMYEFCYIYLSEAKVNQLFNNGSRANRISIYCEDGTTVDEINAVVEEAENILGDCVAESVVYEGSQFKATLDSNMIVLGDTINFMRWIIFSVGIIFSAFFVYQVVAKERSTIGILLAQGYSKGNIFEVFLRYVTGIALLALLLGSAIGIVLVKFASGVYLVEYSIPELTITYELKALMSYICFYILVVIFTCVVSIGRITGVDPCEAYGGVTYAADTPEHLTGLCTSVYVKMAILSMWRNKWRTLIISICIAACMGLLVLAISTQMTDQRALPANFGERFTYDISLRVYEDERVVDGIRIDEKTDHINKNIAFRDEISLNDAREKTQIVALQRGSDLHTLRDSQGNRLDPGDGIILDTWFANQLGAVKGDYVTIDSHELEVTGLADEYIDSTQYISYKTAKLLGHSKTNTVLIKLRQGEKASTALKHYKEKIGVYYGSLLTNYENLCKDSFKSIGTVLNILSCLAVMLGTIIIYNMVVLSASEKKREYAVLLALGVWTREISLMAFVENLFEYIFAVVCAIPVGTYISLKIMSTMSIEGHSYPPYLFELAFVIACLISLLYVFIGVLVTIIKVKKIDPAIALNNNE